MNDSLRTEFPILSEKTYLISNSLGAMPRSVIARMQEFAETWADQWWEMPIEVGNDIAPLIGARAGEVSMHPNMTSILAIMLSCREAFSNGSAEDRAAVSSM